MDARLLERLGEPQEERVGDCGCPEKDYLFDGWLFLQVHWEPDGDVDAYVDDGEGWDATYTATGEGALGEIVTWAAGLTEKAVPI